MSHEAWTSAIAMAAGDRKLAARLVERSERAVLVTLLCKSIRMTEAEFWRLVAKDIEEP